MPIIKSLPSSEKEELKEHRDDTSSLMLKAYTLRQLSFMDWIDTRTVKTSWRYIPIRVDTGENRYRFKRWITKKPYSVLRVRVDEIKFMFNKRTGKKLSVEYR